MFHEYAIATAVACHKLDLKTVAVTSGYVCPAPRAEFYQHMDAANVDLKGFTERFYREVCGGHLQPVLDTLVYLKQHTHVWVELTTLLIPGENDSAAELEQLSRGVFAQLGPDVPLHFTAFHPDWHMRDKPPTHAVLLQDARQIALKNGLRYVYTGNIRDDEGGSTWCHACHQKLIGRDCYDLTAWNLTAEGRCRFCDTPCAGVFEAIPGRWGGQRRPVHIADFGE